MSAAMFWLLCFVSFFVCLFYFFSGSKPQIALVSAIFKSYFSCLNRCVSFLLLFFLSILTAKHAWYLDFTLFIKSHGKNLVSALVVLVFACTCKSPVFTRVLCLASIKRRRTYLEKRPKNDSQNWPRKTTTAPRIAFASEKPRDEITKEMCAKTTPKESQKATTNLRIPSKTKVKGSLGIASQKPPRGPKRCPRKPRGNTRKPQLPFLCLHREKERARESERT